MSVSAGGFDGGWGAAVEFSGDRMVARGGGWKWVFGLSGKKLGGNV